MPANSRPFRPCSFTGCDRQVASKGLCDGHRQQQSRGRPLTPLKTKIPRGGPCSVADCDRVAANQGYCQAHYMRQRRGMPMVPITRASRRRVEGATPEERFFARVVESGDCWDWVGLVNSDGYGTLREAGEYRLAHRWVYEFMVAEIPTGLTIDHLCRNTRCVNPDHLEPVTNSENVRRAWDAVRKGETTRRGRYGLIGAGSW